MKASLITAILTLALSATALPTRPRPGSRADIVAARDIIGTLESDISGIIEGLEQNGTLSTLEGDGQLGNVVGEILKNIDPNLNGDDSDNSGSDSSDDAASSTSVDSSSTTSVDSTSTTTSLSSTSTSTSNSTSTDTSSNSTSSDSNDSSSGGAVTGTSSADNSTGTPLAGLIPTLGSQSVDLQLSDVTPIDDDGSPCGTGVSDIASLLDNSLAVPFTTGQTSINMTAVSLQNNASVIFFVQVDPTGTGNTFAPLQVTTFADGLDNAQVNQLSNEPEGTSVQLKVALPASLQCTGGKNKDLCLVQETNNGGAAGSSGNCIVLQQVAPGTPLPPPPATAPPPPPSIPGVNNNSLNQKPLQDLAAAGTRISKAGGTAGNSNTNTNTAVAVSGAASKSGQAKAASGGASKNAKSKSGKKESKGNKGKKDNKAKKGKKGDKKTEGKKTSGKKAQGNKNGRRFFTF